MVNIRLSNSGSSRISVKCSEFRKYPEFEVSEIPVAECDAYYCPQSIIGALDESVGNSLDEVVEPLVSPVFQGVEEL